MRTTLRNYKSYQIKQFPTRKNASGGQCVIFKVMDDDFYVLRSQGPHFVNPNYFYTNFRSTHKELCRQIVQLPTRDFNGAKGRNVSKTLSDPQFKIRTRTTRRLKLRPKLLYGRRKIRFLAGRRCDVRR